MSNNFLIAIGGILPIIWGITHIIPTKGVEAIKVAPLRSFINV